MQAITDGKVGGIMGKYVYRPKEKADDFHECVQVLKNEHNVVSGWINNITSEVINDVKKGFEKLSIKVNGFHADIGKYNEYLKNAGYFDHFGDYCQGYEDYISEKTFEHYISLQLLEIKDTDVFVDVASENSPVPDIYSKLTGCRSYRQDIMYPSGMSGNRIGSDACQMPVPDQFADKVSLTCSLEHFEKDGDQRLFRELSRILKKNGKVCVIPFYLYTSSANQTDPTVSVPSGVLFDNDATIFCAEGWGNRFGRFYSPDSFNVRIYSTMKDLFDFEVFQIINATEVNEKNYARFALVANKK